MKVLYNDPNDKRYYKWMDNDGVHDIWYLQIETIYDHKGMNLDGKLAKFIDKWIGKIKEFKKDYVEMYPVKLARIEFIYNDEVYGLYPSAVSAIQRTNWHSDRYYDIPWDSLFESYQREIRDDMEKELGVKYSRYIGFLD